MPMTQENRCDALFAELTAHYLNQNEDKKAELKDRIAALADRAAQLTALVEGWEALAQAAATAKAALIAKKDELTTLESEKDKAGFLSKKKRDLRHRIDACREEIAALTKAAEEAEDNRQGFSTREVLEQSLCAVQRKVQRLTAVLEATATARDEADIRAELADLPAGAARLELYDRIRLAQVGDVIPFGAYPQSADPAEGKQAIEWLVLDRKDGNLLAVSKYALDCKPFNDTYAAVTWETCTMRGWLNGEFFDIAFDENEKAFIPSVTMAADENPDYLTDPGNPTRDTVFLLSAVEVNHYFPEDPDRYCRPTPYAVERGAHQNEHNGNCWWWLRSPGFIPSSAISVSNDGDVNEIGYGVDRDRSAVRPALWFTLYN